MSFHWGVPTVGPVPLGPAGGGGGGCAGDVVGVVGSVEGCDWLIVMGADSSCRGSVNDWCGCPDRAGTGWTTTSDDIGVNFNPDGWSDAAHDELMPMLMVKNAMAWVAIWKMADLCIRRLIFAWH